MEKKDKNNRANQLNPNNPDYYKSRGHKLPLARKEKEKAFKKSIIIKNKEVQNAEKFVKEQRKKKPIRLNNKSPHLKIDVGEIYNILQQLVKLRYDLQIEQDGYWEQVEAGYNQKDQLSYVTKRIGEVNDKLNRLIGVLIKHKGQYESYKLALTYLNKEKSRVETLIDAWRKKITKVERRETIWIHSDGTHDYDNTQPEAYLRKQQNKLLRYKHLIEELKKLSDMSGR